MEELRLQLSELYVAYFGRAPDTDGLAYWAAEMDGGIMSYDDIAANWSSEQQEFTDIYGEDVSNDDFIAQVYQNVLGRAPDADGLAYWSGEMSSGTLTTKNMVQAVVAGAKASTGDANDALLLNNKAQAGVKVADSGINDIGFAQKAVAAVTKDASTLQIVKDLVDMAKESSAALAETLNTLTAVKELIDANASDATASAAVLANLAVVIENVAASNTSGAITDISSTLTAVTATVTAAKTDASFIANPETLATSIATDPTAVEENAADVVEEAATPTPPSSSSSSGGSYTPKTPTFMVKDTDGVITFDGTATGDISVAWADTVGDSLATFTRGGKTATADITTTDKITLVSGQTLADTAADLTGLTIDGAGTVNVTALEDTLDADLSGITATTVTVTGNFSQAHSMEPFSGKLGNAKLIVISTVGGGIDITSAVELNTNATYEVGANAFLLAKISDLSGKEVIGDGGIALRIYDADSASTVDTTNISLSDIQLLAIESVDISNNSLLENVSLFSITENNTLTLTAAQAEGKSLSGEGSVTVKDLAEDTDFSTITASCTLTAIVTETLDLTEANLSGLDALTISDEAGTTITVTVTPEQYAALVGKVTLGTSDTLVSTDTTIPTSTVTSAAFDENTGTLTITGTNFDTILETTEDAATDVKARLDWSKLSWDINGDDGSTANVSFEVGDISSVKVTDATTLTITLTNTKTAALIATTGYNETSSSAVDTLDVLEGFIRDMSHNAATADTAADAVIEIIEDSTAPDAPGWETQFWNIYNGNPQAENTVNVTGLEPGAVWYYVLDGSVNWVAGTGSSFTIPDETYSENMIKIYQKDMAGNDSGVSSNPSNIVIDTTAPSVTLTYSTDGGSTYSSTIATKDADTLRIKATFSEDIANDTGATIAIDNSVLEATPMTKTSTTEYYYDLDVPSGDIATASVTIGAAKDAAGNTIIAAPTNPIFAIDNTAPTITSAPTVASATTISLTANENAIAGIYTAESDLIGSTVSLTADQSESITVTAQDTVTAGVIVVTDVAENSTTSTSVGLGTTGDDTISEASFGQFIFGFAGADAFTLKAGNDGTALTQIADYAVNTTGESIIFGGTAAVWTTEVDDWTITNGVATKADATVSDFYTAFITATGDAGEVVAFENGGNTYLFGEGATNGDTDNTAVVLVGITDITAVSVTAAATTVTIA